MMKHVIVIFLMQIGMQGLIFCATNSNVTVYKYRIYCITEAQNVYEWNTVAPTTCPNNTAHVINPNSISIVDQRAPTTFTVQQETVPTAGWFKTETILLNAATGPGVVTTLTHSWPFNVSLIDIYFQTDSTHTGDEFVINWATNQPVGTITANMSAGATTASVAAGTIQNIAVGFYISFNDGTNTDQCGRVTALDTINNIITFETATVHSFAATTPTAVQITVNPVNLIFGPANEYNIARNVVGASHIPAEQVATCLYTNNSNTPKDLYINLEYFY